MITLVICLIILTVFVSGVIIGLAFAQDICRAVNTVQIAWALAKGRRVSR